MKHPSIQEIAIHEAGHAVIDYVLGLGCHEVAITKDQAEELGSYGHVASPDPYFGCEYRSERDRQETMRASSISNCAGLAAEHVFFGKPLRTDDISARQDFQNIIELERYGMIIKGKRLGYVGDELTWAYISRTLKKAKKLVIEHRDVIQRFADALAERGHMTGDEVKQIIEGLIDAPQKAMEA